MLKLKTIIVDDEYLARRLLKANLTDIAEIELVAECENGRQVLEAVSNHNPDLIFMDIQMPGMNGIEVVKAIPVNNMPMIIFTTAYDQYAVSAFDINAVDYLLKPLDEKQVERAVQRAVLEYSSKRALGDIKQHLLDALGQIGHSPSPAPIVNIPSKLVPDESHHYPEKLFIKDGDTITLISMKDIDWVDAAGDYMCVHSDGITHVMRSTMKDLLVQLDPQMFKRIHRSTIINLAKIKRVTKHSKGKFFVYLGCGEQLMVSRSFGSVIKQYLTNKVK
ncbi:LytTR family DNA-binding domain-containing protein [Paraglaciecola sp. MB-3u-78]|uniref:LytR/AlgR family response regulator transcription factor n=1 Tax=Paraglaciecola sp. MB-3u-78 TaxID=2058332 RepID=UPI000C31ED29|nr:LytTR family DNA-binding domain-containing protein [Paraglaciecola sp. MB-3u-78]PKH00184.1 DNA-binding response regulator [Paraglaciecola sp. MB-3u-78]